MKVRTLVIAAGVVALVAATALGAWLGFRPASAETTSGSCDAAYFELSAEKDDGVLEVDFELMSNAPGETWQVTVDHNGQLVLEGERVTDEDAEVDLDLDLQPGATDTFVVTATPEDGAECVARLTHTD